MAGAGARGASRMSFKRPRSTPDDDLATILKNFAIENVAMPGLAGLEAVTDIISRPQTGLSEAYGEYEEGGGVSDVLEGLWRGVSKGYKEAEHPLVEERLVPHQEGEGWKRQLLRGLAGGIADPTVIFGGSIAKLAGKGALVAGRAAKGMKTVKRLADTDAAQMVSRAVFGTDYNVARFGERAGFKGGGKEAVERATRGNEQFRELSELRKYNIGETIKRLGIDVNDEAFMARVTKAHRSGSINSPTKESMFARVLTENYDDYFSQITKFKDDVGDIFTTFDTATGKSVPLVRWKKGEFGPQFLKSEIAEKLATKRGTSEATEELMKRQGLTRAQAERIVNFETGNMKKAGNIEYARVRFGADIFEQNALKNYLRYVDQVEHRMAMAGEFGIKGGKLKELMQGAENAGLTGKTIETFTKGVNKRFEPTPLAGIAPTVLGFQVLTKLGPTSVINQMGQHANNIVLQGLGNYVKSWGKLISRDPKTAQRAAISVRGGLHAQMEQLFSELGAAGGGGIVPKLGSKWLGGIGFKFFDALPRKLASAGGIPTAENAVKKALLKGSTWDHLAKLKITDDLAELGIRKADFNKFVENGKFRGFDDSMKNRLGLKASKLTQFEPDFLSLPPMWQSPEMRIVMQFRSFINEQTRFLWGSVMKPAIRYLDTNGVAGSIKPLKRALIMYPIAGQGVAVARELTKEVAARALGAKRNKRYERKFDYDHPIAQFAKDSLFVGAFGIGGDILEQAARGNLMGWALGPTVGDVTGMVEGGFEQMASGELPEMQDVAEFGARHVPGRRLFPLTPKELTTASTKRGLPGSFREWMEQRQ